MNNKIIYLKDSFKYLEEDKYTLPVILGEDTEGNIVVKDLVDIKNILISGSTSSGKSAFLNSFVCTILTTKKSEDVKFVMIDSKMVNLPFFDGIPNLLFPVVTNVDKALEVLNWCVEEIEGRKKTSYKHPSIVIIVDEFASLMSCRKGIDILLENIAKNGNDVGMYMLLSTSVTRDTVLTKNLKDLIPVRLTGFLPTEEESEMVIEEEGAEDLLGSGDMIYKDISTGEKLRMQTPFIPTDEQEEIIKKVR